MFKKSALIVLIIVGIQCGRRDDTRSEAIVLAPELSDPYFQSFRNKNIKYALLEQIGPRDWRDTLEFDRRGNVVRIRRYGEEEKRTYDEKDFLVRRRVMSDIAQHYIARYSIHGDTLVQIWRELKTLDWDLRDGDTATIWPNIVNFFIFDQNGKVIEEYGESQDASTYVYSKNTLTHKEIEIRRGYEDEFHVERIAEYSYDSKDKIKKIRLHSLHPPEEEEQLIYFSGGVPDSCRVTWKRKTELRQERYKYRYVYY